MSVEYVKEKGMVLYIPPEETVLKEKSDRLIKVFSKYAQAIGLAADEICIQRALIPRILLRVDKREGYFTVFHENTSINEIKQAALVAYWILKFRPFMININHSTPPRMEEFRCLNEGFAWFYILCACKETAKAKGIKTNNVISAQLRKEISYAFTYWDLSKESMIMIAETIGEAFYGIPAEGIDNGCNE